MAMIEADAPRRNITREQLLAALGVLVVLLLLLWFFFLRDGGDEQDPLAVPLPEVTETPGDLELDPSPTPGGPVETFEVFARRDPFEPLVDLNAGTGGAGGTTDTGPGTGGDGTGTGGDGTGTGGDGTGTGGDGGPGGDGGDGGQGGNGTGTGGDGSGQVQGHTVRLIDVFKDGDSVRAQVQVDGTVYTVDEGEVFADNFKLLSASGECASMLFGDDQFTLCEGEEILK